MWFVLLLIQNEFFIGLDTFNALLISLGLFVGCQFLHLLVLIHPSFCRKLGILFLSQHLVLILL